MRLSVALLLAASPAFAGAPKPIADGYSLAFHDHEIVVQHGSAEAKVLGADNLDTVTYDKATDNITIQYMTELCTNSAQAVFTFAALKARLENEPALVLHHNKNWKAALAGFQRAIAADPTWNIPAFNAASAQQLLGDRDGAIATLAPWLKSQPIHTYVQIHQDPELAPLANRPEVKAVEAKAGDVEVTAEGIVGDVAYSPTLKLVAYTREEGSWGNSQFTTELAIWSPSNDGAAIPLVLIDETNNDCYSPDGTRPHKCEFVTAAKRPLATRAAAAQKLLRALGFKHVKSEDRAIEWGANGGHETFPHHKLALDYNTQVDQSFRLMRGKTTVATGWIAGARLHDARVVDEANVLIVWSADPGAEGCMSTNPSYAQVVPLPH